MWRRRAESEVPRRAADGGRPAVRQASGEAWGTRRPRPPSYEVCGRGLALLAQRGPSAKGLPRTCPGQAQVLQNRSHPSRLVHVPSTRRLPPHLTQASTSTAKVLRRGPAQSTRAGRSRPAQGPSGSSARTGSVAPARAAARSAAGHRMKGLHRALLATDRDAP